MKKKALTGRTIVGIGKFEDKFAGVRPRKCLLLDDGTAVWAYGDQLVLTDKDGEDTVEADLRVSRRK